MKLTRNTRTREYSVPRYAFNSSARAARNLELNSAVARERRLMSESIEVHLCKCGHFKTRHISKKYDDTLFQINVPQINFILIVQYFLLSLISILEMFSPLSTVRYISLYEYFCRN